MRRFKVLGLALIATFMVGAVVTSMASAAAMTLPEFSVLTGWKTGTVGKGAKLNATGAEIKCEETGTSEGTATSKSLGSFRIDFKGCELLGKECHSLGDTGKTILTLGIWHLVLIVLGTEHLWLVLFLVTELHIECGTLLITVRGNVLGMITPAPNVKTTKFKIAVAVNAGKEQKDQKYENDAGEVITTKLESNAGLGFVKAVEEAPENEITTEKETEIVN